MPARFQRRGLLVERIRLFNALFSQDHLLYYAVNLNFPLLSSLVERADDFLDKLVVLVLEEVGRILG